MGIGSGKITRENVVDAGGDLSQSVEVAAVAHCLCKETSQELRMLSRSLSDCKSLLLNVMIQVSPFIRNGQLCH